MFILGQLGPIFCYLREKAKESEIDRFTEWVKVQPILSGERLHVSRITVQQFNVMFLVQNDEQRIRMETLCSFLIGREGNSGFDYIGRFQNRSKEELERDGKCKS